MAHPPLAVYIHWPFCRSKCPYCDFNSHVRERIDERTWTAALIADLDRQARWAPEHKVVSIFFGGGTPSLLSPQELASIISQIKKYFVIDPDAEFLYVPAPEVVKTARETGATPFDVPNVDYGHHGEKCSFDAFVERHRLTDPALLRLAEIVRGADTGRPDLTAQSPGLLALSYGLSATFSNDHEQLQHGLVMYDALYAWCRSNTLETRKK